MRGISNESGSSLVQVMVSLALMGIIAAGLGTMMHQLANQQKIAQSRQDILVIAQEVLASMSNSATCLNAIVPNTPFNFVLAQSVYPPTAGNPIAGSPFRFRLNSIDTLQDNQTLQNYNLIVNRVLLVNAGSAGISAGGLPIYSADILADFSPKGNLVSFSPKSLGNAFFTVSGGNIVGCSTIAPPSLVTIRETCTSLGGTINPTTGACITQLDLPNLCSTFNGTYASGKCTITAAAGAPGGSQPRWAKIREEMMFNGHTINFPLCYTGQPTVEPPIGGICSSPGLNCTSTQNALQRTHWRCE